MDGKIDCPNCNKFLGYWNEVNEGMTTINCGYCRYVIERPNYNKNIRISDIDNRINSIENVINYTSKTHELNYNIMLLKNQMMILSLLKVIIERLPEVKK